ncbi:PP2C family protein-serine/threonine phosphatase [Streptomyces sp. NPDC059171]|uniref:PP2C family protein-serine/threonine phosphatase n=1 Tax=unclassified Streptomyces TaxID=2593676 RepID=UPI0036857A3D
MRRPERSTIRSSPNLLPVATMLGIAAVDAATGSMYVLLPVYAAGPAIASARGTVRSVTLMGAAAAVLCLLSAWKTGRYDDLRLPVALTAIAYVTLASAYAARSRRKIEQSLVDVREVARTLEDVLFTPVPPTIGPVRIGASYVSANHATRIGGDLYDVEPFPGGLRLVIADVQGKGLGTVRCASVALAAFRESAPSAHALTDVGLRIEQALERRTDGERFVTGILAQIGTDGSLLVFNHGHPPPLLLPRAGRPMPVESDEPVPPFGLAVLTGTTDLRDSVTRLTLNPGDRLFFYTDGLSEARNSTGHFYPVHERVPRLLKSGTPEEALDLIRADVATFTSGPPDDDSALLLMEFQSPS